MVLPFDSNIIAVSLGSNLTFFLGLCPFFLAIDLKLPNTISQLNISFDVLLKLLPEVGRLQLMNKKLLANRLILLPDQLEFLLMVVPIAPRDKLVFVGVKGSNGGLDVPYPFEEEHVLLLEVVLVLPFLEDLGC